jgi:hypothetical protein
MRWGREAVREPGAWDEQVVVLVSRGGASIARSEASLQLACRAVRALAYTTGIARQGVGGRDRGPYCPSCPSKGSGERSILRDKYLNRRGGLLSASPPSLPRRMALLARLADSTRLTQDMGGR